MTRFIVMTMTLAVALAPLQGCALVQGRYQTVSIETNVPARISVEGREIGVTSGNGPIFASLRRSKTQFVTAEASGHRTQTASLQAEISTLGVLDVVGGVLILFPFITLLTGHAFELVPDYLRLHLSPDE